MKVNYGIRACKVTNIFLKDNCKRMVEICQLKNVFECILRDIKNIFVKINEV